MKDTPFYIALKIATIIEEHSEKDIRAAVSLLETQGSHSRILDYLAGREINNVETKHNSTKLPTRSVEEQKSKIILSLEHSNPEKYKVLSEFELSIRKGQILPTLEDLKRFGERISKDFSPRKSRKDTIGVLLALIVDMPLEDIENLIISAANFGNTDGTDDYQRLAKFLIKGKPESNGEI